MSTIQELDKNLAVDPAASREGMVFHDIKAAPFKIYGMMYEGNLFRRMPEAVAASVSDAVNRLSRNTAGGRVRFKTNSPYVIIKPILPNNVRFAHMAATNMLGFDMYVSENGGPQRFTKTFIPPLKFEEYYTSAFDFADDSMRTITINFPCYGEVHDFYIGIKEGSELLPPEDYKIDKPMVYYGSSITQGGCASRPGTSYQAHISRWFDADYINLGFSGNGRGEPAASEYIANLEMSAFIMDYDHNAPTIEHYRATHEPFFKAVREKNPDLPIIIMTRPKINLSDSEIERIDIAKTTYTKAYAAGDKNVYFIDGRELMCEEGTVDNCHPTDLGFMAMANRLAVALDKIFKRI